MADASDNGIRHDIEAPKRKLVVKLLASLAITLAMLAGCTANKDDRDEVRSGFTVTGVQSELETFGKQQAAKNSQLSQWSFDPIGGGKSEATVWLPHDFQGADLVRLSADAAASGFSYKLVPPRVIRTVPQ